MVEQICATSPIELDKFRSDPADADILKSPTRNSEDFGRRSWISRGGLESVDWVRGPVKQNVCAYLNSENTYAPVHLCCFDEDRCTVWGNEGINKKTETKPPEVGVASSCAQRKVTWSQ